MSLHAALASVLLLPLLAAIVVGSSLLARKSEAVEGFVGRAVALLLAGAFLAAVAAAGLWWAGDEARLYWDMGQWFVFGKSTFVLAALLDAPSVVMLVLTALSSVLVAGFSRRYLHRERGYRRFFLLLSVFSFAMQAMVLAGTLDLFIVGWELVGLCSVLLIGFFYERAAPARAALRVFVTYRLCDVGLYAATLFAKVWGHSSSFLVLFGEGSWTTGHVVLAPSLAGTVGACLVLAAAGKSSQAPFAPWLPKAMEGPTPSSALFYGAVSIHGGVYLLLRAAPLLHAAPWVSACVVVIGALTAIKATLAGRVQTDAKSILAYAIMAQAGLLFVECGLGLHTLALIHLVGHGLLRAYQLIRAPSALADARMLAMASNGDHATRSAPSWDSYMRAFRPLLSDRIVDGGLVPALFRLGHWLEQWEQRVAQGEATTRHGNPNPNEVKPLSDLGPEGTAKTGEWGHAP